MSLPALIPWPLGKDVRWLVQNSREFAMWGPWDTAVEAASVYLVDDRIPQAMFCLRCAVRLRPARGDRELIDDLISQLKAHRFALRLAAAMN